MFSKEWNWGDFNQFYLDKCCHDRHLWAPDCGEKDGGYATDSVSYFMYGGLIMKGWWYILIILELILILIALELGQLILIGQKCKQQSMLALMICWSCMVTTLGGGWYGFWVSFYNLGGLGWISRIFRKCKFDIRMSEDLLVITV